MSACQANSGVKDATGHIESVATPHILEIQTPTPGWQLVAAKLYQLPDSRFICIYQLTPPEGMSLQVISSTSCSIQFQSGESAQAKVESYVLGKTWNWNGNPEVSFINSVEDLKDALADAKEVPFTLVH